LEHACRDPKDGELCLSEAKPEETLVEARRAQKMQRVSIDGTVREVTVA